MHIKQFVQSLKIGWKNRTKNLFKSIHPFFIG